MIILDDYIKELQKLQDEGYGKLPVIYAADDEGNLYHTVYNISSPIETLSIDDYYIELADETVNPNAIIIN